MYIKIAKKIVLNESETFQTDNQQYVPGQKIGSDIFEEIIRMPSKQIKFSNGVIMAKIKQPVDNKFGLKWHFENTNNFDEFIESIKKYVGLNPEISELTVSDIKKLENQYLSVNK